MASTSQLTFQLEKERMLATSPAPAGADLVQRPNSPSKIRPRSSLGVTPTLSPSPAFLEPSKISKDDSFLTITPSTPKRESSHAHSLSLQMPSKETTLTNNLSGGLLSLIPLSPKLDSTSSYGSPTSALPRRSRGMDYSRACTNLHYSTLAEQSSPDLSPVVGGKAVNIPGRRSHHRTSNGSNVPDSPGSGAPSLWSTMGNGEKSVMGSSVSSVNMIDSDAASSSSEEDAVMGQVDDEDTIHGTPQALGRNPFLNRSTSSPSRDSVGPFSPSAASLMSFRHARLHHHKSRKSSSSVSGRSSLTSPAPGSPPLLKSVETMSHPHGTRTLEQTALDTRRQSLSLGTNQLQISDLMALEDAEAQRSPCDPLGLPFPTNSYDERRNVIRKAVTRGRSNLLVSRFVSSTPSMLTLTQPKSKNFTRIRACLHEESSPIDTEVKREAEVIRQVRESDGATDLNLQPSHPATSASSPVIQPLTASPPDLAEESSGLEPSQLDISTLRRSSSTFSNQAMRNSSGATFWNNFDEQMRTPPPPGFPRGGSISTNDDMPIDTPNSSTLSSIASIHQPIQPNMQNRSRSSTPQPIITAASATRIIGKRRRDDDLEANHFKRRAVSPGVSLGGSPIIPSSPAQRESGWWSMSSKSCRETPSGHVNGDRVNSGGSISGSSSCLGSQKRVGLQGMTDTNDGLMNMSIE